MNKFTQPTSASQKAPAVRFMKRARQLAGCAALSLCAAFQTMASTPLNQPLGPDGLGDPSIAVPGVDPIVIATGTGIVAAGTGLALGQPDTIDITVPGTVKQALIYWEGQMRGDFPIDDTIEVDGVVVKGTLIGGPTHFFGRKTPPYKKNSTFSSVYRADITGLGLVGTGANALSVGGVEVIPFDKTAPAGSTRVINGAGIMVVYEDGPLSSEIGIRDGLDLAFINFGGYRNDTVKQTFDFTSSNQDRMANLALFFSSVAGASSGGGTFERPESVEVEICDNGTCTKEIFSNTLASLDGEEWDTVNLLTIIPAGANSLNVQAFSRNDDPVCAGLNPKTLPTTIINEGDPYECRLPASFTWTAVGLSVETIKPSKLGDRVWEDRNADGIQDCEDTNNNGKIGDAGDTGAECDAGIKDIPVALFAGDCTTPSNIPTTETDADGFYLFDDLAPGDYCVKFGTPPKSFCDENGFELGDPVLTTQNATGNSADTVDSDANDAGFSDPVRLAVGETNLTIDAGFYCPAKIGDRVWKDDGDGIQQCEDTDNNGMIGSAGDTGAECDSGVKDVTVTLFECGADGQPGGGDDTEIGERMTDGEGFYMFGAEGKPDPFDLPHGTYYVQFDQNTLPADYVLTAPKQGGDDTLDSDCMTPDGITQCVTVGPRGINLNRDCGITKPCDLQLDKQCRVEPKPPVTFEKCDGKLKQFTVIWDNPLPATITGTQNIASYAPTGVVNPSDAVTFSGFSSNNVYVNFDSADPSLNGRSVFHVSCSDSEFNSPDDCGKAAGDGKKSKEGFDNTWTLGGFVDNAGKVLDCNGGTNNGPFADNCEFPASPLSCETTGKPTSLTLKYTGGGCDASDNDQDKDKCTEDGIVSGDVTVLAAKKLKSSKVKDLYTVSPDYVMPDGTFELTFKGGEKFKSNTTVAITNGLVTEVNQIHTSCSNPLAVGDVFGSLTVVAINGQSGGTDVTYKYTVTNNGPTLFDLKVTDVPLGDIGTIESLLTGASATLETTVPIAESTTNTGTVVGFEQPQPQPQQNGKVCTASDSVMVKVTPPPTPPAECKELKPIDALILEYDASQAGGKSIDKVSWYSKEVDNNNFINSTGPVSNGDVVTFDGFAAADADNNVDFLIEFSDGGTATSRFHRSCSDDDMNDVTDCGTLQGNGKDGDGGLLNTWILRDLAGNGKVLGCP